MLVDEVSGICADDFVIEEPEILGLLIQRIDPTTSIESISRISKIFINAIVQWAISNTNPNVLFIIIIDIITDGAINRWKIINRLILSNYKA
jgi:hypothetical protein